MKFFTRLFGKSEDQKMEEYSRKKFEELEKQNSKVVEAASVNGKHYVNHVETIKQLKREDRRDQAIELLLKCVNATEAESAIVDCGVAPWYYEQLAILYRKQKDYKSEVEILERYHSQLAAAGVGKEKLAERLIQAKALLEK
ncbi:hypothetical protein [Nitrincola sp. MINF-07-Sa-05]|uniref:hypothetical protein n=1 Tax=Nitrincola salilacus TaxID=3400273 RepID=UPI00391859EC